MALQFFIDTRRSSNQAFCSADGRVATPRNIALGDVASCSVRNIAGQFDASQKHAFSVKPATQLSFQSFYVVDGFGNRLTGALPFDVSAERLAFELNSNSNIVSLGGIGVQKVGAVYFFGWARSGAQTPLHFITNSNEVPPSVVLEPGADGLSARQAFITRFGPVASTSGYVVNDNILSFNLNLNTIEAALLLQQRDSVPVVAELISYTDAGNRLCLAQGRCLLFNNVVDLSNVEFATTQIQSVVSVAQSFASQAEQAKVEAENAKSEAEQAKAEAVNAMYGAENFKSQAEQACAEAKAISDPENRIGSLQESTQSLQLFKSNSGALHFNNGRATTGTFALTLPFTAMMRVKFDKDNSPSGILGLFGAGKNKAHSMATPFSLSFNFGTKKIQMICNGLVESVNRLIGYDVPFGWDNNVHTLVWVVRSVDATGFDCDLYIDGLLQTKTQIYKDNQAHSAFDSPNDSIVVLNKDSLLYGHVSNPYPCDYNDVYLLNFDVSAEDAPYTFAGYQQGKPIPPEYLLGGGERFKFVRATENTDWNLSGYNCSGSLTEADGVYTLGKGTLTEGQTNYQSYLRVKFSSVIKAGSKVEIILKKVGDNLPYLIRFTANAFTITNTGDYKLLNDSRLWSNDVLVDNKIELTQDCNGGFIQLGNSFDTFSFIDFQIKVNGALLALENYTLNGKVLDYSGNANDATCSGSVKGDNDNRVQRLVDFIKA